jgi:hypothetical protein
MAPNKTRGWIVRVYRRSARENEGRSGGIVGSGGGGWNRLVAKKNGKGGCAAVRAVPQRGFIVLPRIRARICLSKSGETPKNDGGNVGGGGEDENGCSTLVQLQRRGDAILVRGRGRSRTLLLRFRSEQECLDFSDRLVALNRPPPSESIKEPLKSEPTRSGDAFRRNNDRALVATTTTAVVATEAEAEESTDLDVEEVAAYLARLLCDPEFDGLVQGLEACVASHPDLQAMLEAKASEGSGNS